MSYCIDIKLEGKTIEIPIHDWPKALIEFNRMKGGDEVVTLWSGEGDELMMVYDWRKPT